MATKEEKMAQYVEQLEELGVDIDMKKLEEVVDGLGPANYNADASLVSCSDEEELNRVYTNFVADELSISDSDKGGEMIAKVCEQMSGINRKHRAVFYYLLATM